MLKIVRFPDPALRRVAEAVTAFDDQLRAFALELLETMRAAPGIGITAPHVGVPKRLVVIDLGDSDGARFYVNPRVEWASTETARYDEGSVSMPGIAAEVERPARVRVAYQDLDGAPREVEAKGLLAVCLQHEIDQLDGIFWLQRLSRLRRDRLVKQFSKSARGA